MYAKVLVFFFATGAMAGILDKLPLDNLAGLMSSNLPKLSAELEELSARMAENEEKLEEYKSETDEKDEEILDKIEDLAEKTMQALEEQKLELIEMTNATMMKLLKSWTDQAMNTKKYGSDDDYSVPDHEGMLKLQEEMQKEIYKRLEKVEQKMSDLKLLIKESSGSKTPGFKCDVTYGGKCFMIVLAQLTVDQAKFRCKEMGAELANIYAKVQYEQIMAKTRNMITYHTQMYLGMTYDQTRKKALMRDGTEAPYLKWHKWFPNSSGIWIGFAVDPKNPSSEHMTNFTPPHTANGCVCEAPARR